jgi:GLPGLI family protein
MNTKTTIIAFLLVSSFLGTAQSNKHYAKAKVTYGITLHLERNNEVYKIYEKYFPELAARSETTASEIDFSLILNDSISFFYLEKKLYSDNRAASFAIGESKYFGRIKQKPENYITEELQEDFGKFLVSRPYQDWVLRDESKMIGDYLCFKATTFYTITSPAGKVFKHNFTAWYAPQLPYKFGPSGYGNLPGLIIELQGKDFTLGVSKITFYEDALKSKENEMPQLKNKRLIIEEEFEKLAAEDEKRWRNRKK